MYQALYRKYRPKTFEDVYGQDIIVKILKNTIINNKISHAYLFTGPRGTGKTSIAKIFANTVNCKNLNGATPCGKCESCEQINNMDIIEIDAASNNGVDEIRNLKEKINLVPSINKYKVYIIDEVHMLTIGAFNALLKTLEEPPPHVIFILATTEVHKIPITILSRCQRFDFKKISENIIIEKLKKIIEKEKIKINFKAIMEIARLADGGMRDAISILDQVIAYSDENITEEDIHNINGTLTQYQLKNIISSIIDENLEEIFEIIEEYDNKGKNLIKIVEEIILFFKNLLLIKTLKNINEEKIDKEIYNEYLDKIDLNEIYNIILNFNNAIYEMKKNNNPKLILELNIIKMIKNDDIVEKISQKKDNVQNTQIKKNEEKNIKNDDISDEKLEELKKIRVNNTLANLNKKIIKEVENKVESLHQMMFTTSFGEYISMIIDGNIKAASNENLIFIYENIILSKKFNKNIKKIEKMFKELLNLEYKVIAVSKEEWEIIKKEFNSKTKVYQEIDEKNLINEIFKEEEQINEFDNLFGEIIEYN